MKLLIVALCLGLTSCTSLIPAMRLIPDISIDNRTTVNETKHVQETKTVHYYNIEVKDSSKLSQVPELGVGEKKIYFYSTP
jgi:hypothetical protein